MRARINVLSEVADEWRQHLSRWSRINRSKKRLVNAARAPSRNDEYLLYQTLIGTWPLEPLDEDGIAVFRERIETYMLKAVKEAKLHTSWINPNTEYEDAMRHFVRTLLDKPEQNAFLTDFLPFRKRLARFGLYNSLSQTLLKLTVPGLPDTYQGSELWSFNLVDPDNRRPVDYEQRQAMLRELTMRCEAGGSLPGLMQELLQQIENGKAKLYLTWKTLILRRENAELFLRGEYISLVTQGPKADHICAFSRRLNDKEIIVVASRWFARLLGESDSLPIGHPAWDDTRVQENQNNRNRTHQYRNVLTDETIQAVQTEAGNWLNAVDLFRHLPVALLINN